MSAAISCWQKIKSGTHIMRFSPSEKMHVTKIKEQIPALAKIVLEATKQMGIGAPMALISGSTPDLSHLTHFAFYSWSEFCESFGFAAKGENPQ